jgi:methyl acetate hydrolase
MPVTKAVDEVLKSAVEQGDVPGVVAMAATRDGMIYQGAFGPPAQPGRAATGA